MIFDFSNQVIGISGASSPEGIGFAVAKRFLQSNATVFICSRRQETLDHAKELLKEYGDIHTYTVDVSDETAVETMFSMVRKDLGPVDVFVNNAGIYPQIPLVEMTLSQWNQVLDVNLTSVFLCAREAFHAMKGRGGVLINAASYAALIPSAGSGAYAASKSAICSLTQTMAAEFAPYGIRVNGFIPGVIETEMTKHVIGEKRQELEGAIPMKRLGTPEDVANSILFLASEEASYITGTFLEVSGGKLCVQNASAPWKWKEEGEK